MYNYLLTSHWLASLLAAGWLIGWLGWLDGWLAMVTGLLGLLGLRAGVLDLLGLLEGRWHHEIDHIRRSERAPDQLEVDSQ